MERKELITGDRAAIRRKESRKGSVSMPIPSGAIKSLCLIDEIGILGLDPVHGLNFPRT